MLSAKPGIFEEVEQELTKLYGPVDLQSSSIDFNYTDYYESEMGPNLKRKFLSFKHKIDPGKLAGIKLQTQKLEETFAHREDFVSRPVNLDPGYICGSKLVLGSTKDYAHRIYLNHGIYAEITLLYHKKKFIPIQTTYPDYHSEEYIEFFTKVRERHLSQEFTF